MNDFTKEEFKCARCLQTYLKGWSDREAEFEYKDALYNIPGNDREVICDDCFQEFKVWLDGLTEDDHKRIRNE